MFWFFKVLFEMRLQSLTLPLLTCICMYIFVGGDGDDLLSIGAEQLDARTSLMGTCRGVLHGVNVILGRKWLHRCKGWAEKNMTRGPMPVIPQMLAPMQEQMWIAVHHGRYKSDDDMKKCLVFLSAVATLLTRLEAAHDKVRSNRVESVHLHFAQNGVRGTVTCGYFYLQFHSVSYSHQVRSCRSGIQNTLRDCICQKCPQQPNNHEAHR